MSKQYEIEITPEDIKAGVIEDVKKQISQMGYGMMQDFDYEGVAKNMMQKQETVEKKYEELQAEAVMNRISETVTLTPKSLTLDEYKEMVEQMQ